MKILVIGSGGRETAICWKLVQSSKCDELYCAPGNAGTAELAKNLPVTGINELISFVKKNDIGLTVVGPETPLVDGIVDEFEKQGLKIFGPSKAASRLEGSKAFSKNIMKKYSIPTAYYEEFTSSKEAINFLKNKKVPIVIKADGLAAGKGVIIALSHSEAENAIKSILDEKQFGHAGDKIIIEEFLEGEEASLLCFCDGTTIVPMESSQDHKRIFDNDKGPNTGGMGAYSPAPVVDQKIMDQVKREILAPTMEAMEKEGCPFKGVLFVGLMIHNGYAKVLEYNCRFGDPETQAVLPRMKTDLVDVIEAVIEESLDKIAIEWDAKSAVCVVASSGGYPGDFKKGYTVEGLGEVYELENIIVFQAGTTLAGCEVSTSGGRVLGVTGLGDDIHEAIQNAYYGMSKLHFTDMYYRKDIGSRGALRCAHPNETTSPQRNDPRWAASRCGNKMTQNERTPR